MKGQPEDSEGTQMAALGVNPIVQTDTPKDPEALQINE
jgi:hypothetical protein